MNILHLSDIHFRQKYDICDEGYKSIFVKMQNPLISLKKTLDILPTKKAIDLVIISGDLTEDGTTEDYHYLKKWLKSEFKDTDIIVTLGNHDIRENFWDAWYNQKNCHASYNQITSYPDFTIISFDNSYHNFSDGFVDKQQMDWLKTALEVHKNNPIMLVTHHHLLACQSSMPIWPGTQEFLKIIAPYNISCILNGHTHHPYTAEINKIPYFTAPSMSFIGEDENNNSVRFEERFGCQLYTVVQGHIVHQTTENFIPGHILKTIQF